MLQHLRLQQAGKMGVFNVANELDKWGEGVSDMALQQYFLRAKRATLAKGERPGQTKTNC